MLNDWLNTTLISIQGYDLTIGAILGCLFATLVLLALIRLSFIGIGRYGVRHKMDEDKIQSLKRWIILGAILSLGILCLLSLHLDWVIWNTVTARDVIVAILLIVVAKVADKIISARILEEIDSQTVSDIYRDQYGKKNRSNITRIVQYVLMILVSILVIRNFDWDIVLFSVPLANDNSLAIKLTMVLMALLILMITRLIVWTIINLVLYGWYKRERIDLGKQYAYNQLLSYVIYFIAVVFALRYIGIDLTILLAGAAFLLVGVGIALQQVFSDFFSGIVILFERSVEVGDVLDFGTMRGTVKKIGLRASIIETIEQKDVIMPNSKMVNDNVVNWSSTRKTTMFKIEVGVAYGTDTRKVESLLLKAASEVPGILSMPPPQVRFVDFGESSYKFLLLFYSDQIERIEKIRSDLRFKIDELFKAHNITIPFPQRDVWMRK